MNDSTINQIIESDHSSPAPEFDEEELKAYHSLADLLETTDDSPCTIIPPTPLNENNILSPLYSHNIMQGNFHLTNERNEGILSEQNDSELNVVAVEKPVENLMSNESFVSEDSFCYDSDADPEYFLPAHDERMIDLLREDVPCCSKTLTTKRIRHPENWNKNKRKIKCQRGEEFIDDLGIQIKKRQIKMGCGENCPYACHEQFDLSERTNIFEKFWQLNSKSKGDFFGKMVFRMSVERKRTNNPNSRRKNTYQYHFLKAGMMIRVCQVFFTHTLDINKTRIHYYFDHLIDTNTTTSKSPAKGKHQKNKLPQNKLDDVAAHINSFATVESHYCRSSTNKKFLEPQLNLKKMYMMYCNETDGPVKFWSYKHIFETRFNLGFFIPKKDLCNKYEEHKRKAKNGEILTHDEHNDYTTHIQNKLIAKAEKDTDKTNIEPNTRVMVIDLQNVFALPKANVNSFYYKRKLLCFNLTGYCKDNRSTYCSIWNETSQGRGANELASAFVKILRAVITDFPQTEKFIIWTDACVPQNRNSILSLSLLNFMKENQGINVIEHKYSEPGHSLLQEVDAVHSTLEKYLRNMEIYSPIGLVRLLANAKFPKVKLKILQIRSTDFMHYSQAAQKFNFSCIPYTKTRHLKYDSQNLTNVSYKRSFNENFVVESILKPTSSRRTRRNLNQVQTEFSFDVQIFQSDIKISEEKRKDLLSLLKFMQIVDQHFYHTALKPE